MFELYTSLLAAASITNLLVLLIMMKQVGRSAVRGFFFLFLFAISVWGIPRLIINTFGLTGFAYTEVNRISALGYILVPTVFFTFSLAFTKRLELLRNKIIFLYTFLPPIIFLYLSWTTNIIENHAFDATLSTHWGVSSPTGEYFAIFLAWFESLMLISMLSLIGMYKRTASKVQKRQSLLLIIAILIPLFFGTITDGILPLFDIHTFPSAIPLTSVMAILIGYAITRYELFEFEPDIILSHIGNGLFTIGRSGRILKVNSAGADMIGLLESEIVGKNIKEFLTASKKRGRRITANMTIGKTFHSSAYSLITDSSIIPVAITVSPVKSNKKIVGATVLFQDISEEKRQEESKEEFLSIASHELKTPITSIKLYTELLSRKLRITGDESIGLVEKLQEQVERVVGLTNDLLDLSRLQSGKIQLHLEAFDLCTLTETIIDSVRSSFPDHEIVLEGTVSKQVFADRLRIGQVLTNLLTNAVKYSPRDRRVIVRLSDEDDRACVSVQDFGKGIRNTEQQKIFDRFYQVSVKEGEEHSLGIGLYVAARIIKKHKGKIWVDSKLNKGSTFSFTIPLAHSESL